MHVEGFDERRWVERLPRGELRALQLERLKRLLATILPDNQFYARKLAEFRTPPESLDELAQWPFTTKGELIAKSLANDDRTEPVSARLAANRTFPLDRYVRCHRTSGTRGEPLVVLDTADDWQWWIEGWQFVLDAARIDRRDRVVLAFSFGPFIGFWSAFDAVLARGAMTIPTGGMNTLARLQLIQSLRATAVLCTPSYALHLASSAEQEGIDLRACGVRAIVVAGEPGGSIPAVRERIQSAWNAQVIDHAGATEAGPWGYGDASGEGLYVNESQFLAEWIDPATGLAAGDGQVAELVLTSLGRAGAPMIRYRTGDLAKPDRSSSRENQFAFLLGGILGRADDMLTVRGVNIFPSSLEDILWSEPGVREYRATVRKSGALDSLSVDVEGAETDVARLATRLQLRLGLRVEVQQVPAGTLPRFEGKGRRVIDERAASHSL